MRRETRNLPRIFLSRCSRTQVENARGQISRVPPESVKIVISTRSGEILSFDVVENARSLTGVRDEK
jgi:hypothetical protein